MGIFHAKGWGSSSSCPPSKVCLPWVSKGGTWDVPGILLGCPDPCGCSRSLRKKTFVRIFRSLPTGDPGKGTAKKNVTTICDKRHDNLRQFANDLRKIAVVPDKLEGETAGLQVSWALISKTLPPRVVHLLRAHPVEQTLTHYKMHCWTLSDSYWANLGQPTITADQLHLSRLPVTAGGLGLPHLPTLTFVARASCIATLSRAAHTDPFRETLVRQEGEYLLERLRGVNEKHPAQMAGDLLEAPTGLSLRHLSRKFTRSIHSKAVSDLWKRRLDLEDTLRHQWLCNLPGDSPTQPDGYHGHGEWLHCLPGKWRQPCLTQSSDWVYAKDGVILSRAQDKDVAEPPGGQTMHTHSRSLWEACRLLYQRPPHPQTC